MVGTTVSTTRGDDIETTEGEEANEGGGAMLVEGEKAAEDALPGGMKLRNYA